MKYTKEQIETALGVMSGRIDPMMEGMNCLKAEEILLALIFRDAGGLDSFCALEQVRDRIRNEDKRIDWVQNAIKTTRLNELCESGRHIGHILGTLEGALISDGISQPLKECIAEAIKSIDLLSQRNAAELKRLTGE